MTALFLTPNKLISVAQSGGTTQGQGFLSNDEKGLVWRTVGLTGNYLTFQLDGSEIDFVALVGTNLKPANSVRIRLGNSATQVNGSSAPVDVVVSPASGTAAINQTVIFKQLDAPGSYSHVRFDFTATGNPDGYVEVSRVVIGKAVTWLGIDIDAEFTYQNDSKSVLDDLATNLIWKAKVSSMTEAEYFTYFHPLMRSVAKKTGFLFIPTVESDYVQEQATFGVIDSSPAKGSYGGSDFLALEFQIRSLF